MWFGEAVWPRLGLRVRAQRRDGGARCTHDRLPAPSGIAIAPGEEPKTLATAQAVWEATGGRGHTRADTLLAVGGGVVGDLGGFCAATYQRGMPVVHVPTTRRRAGRLGLRRQDGRRPAAGEELRRRLPPAGRGARRALDARDAARARAAPPATPRCVKTALIAGGPLWDAVRAGARRRPRHGARVRAHEAARSSPPDERDAGLRQVLNLGHTVAHALETVTGYSRLLHGEAVALGLLAALRLSGQDALRDEVAELLAGAGLPLSVGGVDAGRGGARDRAWTRSGWASAVPFVLVEAPGAVTPGPRRRRSRPAARRARVARA